jgi:thiol-disulfide isomerase/thioredoxin
MFLHEYFLTTSNYKSDFNKMRNKLGRKFFKSESFQNEFEKHLKFIQKEYTGIACEIIQSQKLYGLLDGINRVDVFENLYPNFKKELRNSFCNILDAKYIEVKLLENNEDDNNSLYKSENGIEGQANNILKKIIDQNKGKVIYIDFWAIWCGPCLKEFGYSKNVAKTFEGKKIEFVYCCVKSEKEKWEEKIRDYRLSGSQYLLNDSEYDVLSQKFQITGIPHYVLIDKNGKIIDKNAPRPSSGEELVNMINKYLN